MKQMKKIFIATLCILLSLPAATANAAVYTVSENDSLYSISQLFDTSKYFLRSSNNFEGKQTYSR